MLYILGLDRDNIYLTVGLIRVSHRYHCIGLNEIAPDLYQSKWEEGSDLVFQQHLLQMT